MGAKKCVIRTINKEMSCGRSIRNWSHIKPACAKRTGGLKLRLQSRFVHIDEPFG
jgi:hypothetical protein